MTRQHPTIPKAPGTAARTNLGNYAAAREAFSWAAARAELDGLPEGALNIAYEAVDRHVAGGRGEHLAVRFIGRRGEIKDFSYGALMEDTSRFANVLAGLGIRRGDHVFALLPRSPDLHVTCLGALKNGSVFAPLFTALGSEPIAARLTLGECKLLVTTEALYTKKVAAIRASVPSLEQILLVGAPSETDLPMHTGALEPLMHGASAHFAVAGTAPEDPALIHFTNGVTGQPQGSVQAHDAVVSHHVAGRLALDFHDDDVFWSTTDPGWVTATSYGILSPLTNGITTIVDEGDFDADRWLRILRDQHVSVLYTAPTAVRMMARASSAGESGHDAGSLRFIASSGEPHNPEAVFWGQEAFGLPIHDNWWQTETGGILIANYASMDIRPGSMGRPLPGIDAAIVRRVESRRRGGDGARVSVEVVDGPGVQGELAFRRGWPSMFRAYLHDEARYAKRFADDWYLTGDVAKRDADGYFWLMRPGADAIKRPSHVARPHGHG
jgi:acetyl-CoA synthetase